MSKIIIKSTIKSSDNIDELKDKKALYINNKITYDDNGVNTSIEIMDNEVILTRENGDTKVSLYFNKYQKRKSIYELKSHQLTMDILVDTKELLIEKNKINVIYDLYINDELSDTFTYELEWSDL